MSKSSQSPEMQRKRAQAVRSAWILGLMSFAIFVIFVVMAMTER